MLHSSIARLMPIALTLVGFVSNVKSASAATYDFSATYDTTVTISPFNPEFPDIVRAAITGDTTDAPYGLNFFTSNTYGQTSTDPVTSITKTTFNSDPTAFGLPGQQLTPDRYFGGANELFGKASDSAVIDPGKGTISGGGTITIFDGTGIFQGATGQITFTEADKLGPDPTVPSQGQAVLKFSLETPKQVPEPTATPELIGITMIGGACFLLRRKRHTTIVN